SALHDAERPERVDERPERRLREGQVCAKGSERTAAATSPSVTNGTSDDERANDTPSRPSPADRDPGGAGRLVPVPDLLGPAPDPGGPERRGARATRVPDVPRHRRARGAPGVSAFPAPRVSTRRRSAR